MWWKSDSRCLASQFARKNVIYSVLLSLAITWSTIESKGTTITSPITSSQGRRVPMSHRVQALFDENLARNRDLSIDQLAVKFPPRNSTTTTRSAINLENVTYYRDFMTDPEVVNAETRAKVEQAKLTMTQMELDGILHGSEHHELKKLRQFDFRLNERETEKLQKHGLVVSERFQVDSFAEGYYRTYTDDLPVYVTADSIQHAWHRSYDVILQEIESKTLITHLENLTCSLIHKIHELRKLNGTIGRQFRWYLDEIEFFLGVGIELLMQGRNETRSELDDEWYREDYSTTLVEKPKLSLAVRNKVQTALTWVMAERMQTVEVFGQSRDVDFSLFIPRGHYTTPAELTNYFQAMMWFSTIDFRIAGPESSEHELMCALVFGHVVRQANMYEKWSEFDKLLTLLVGEPDSMSFGQLIQLTDDADLNAYFSASSSRNETFVDVWKQRIVSSGSARRVIAGHPLPAENLRTTKPTELPLSFKFFGQRFLIDSFALSKVVFDQVSYRGQKVKRRVPSGLDVAFAVFQNDAALSEISKRIRRQGNASEFVEFRDGYEYSSNLAALRLAADLLEPEYMSSSLVNRWLDTLRTLSEAASHHSWTCQSTEWQTKQLVTQLASWVQLRHDNLLYVKQSYKIETRCEYPAGFVEPYPKFWRKMKELARAAVTQLSQSSIVNSSSSYRTQREFFERFAESMNSLEVISGKQTTRENLTDEETRFLKTVIEEWRGSGGSRYQGWYPKLFYASKEDSGKADYIVTDVHTDTPDQNINDPGSILHVGIGKVLTAFVVVEGEDGKSAMYAGPVYSYYEFLTAINERVTDEAWAERITKGQTPSLPPWAKESLLSRN